MNIISVDVGWKEKTERNAVAIAKPGGRIHLVRSGLGDSDLITLVQGHAEPESLVLLDVPVEGCEGLSEPQRPVESVLHHYIALYPASMAGTRGIRLKRALLRAMPASIRESIVIQEIYPHAVYKFLWAVAQRGKLERVHSGVWERLLDRGFTSSVSPPKYKGGRYSERLDGMRQLYNLLTERLMLKFSPPLDPPHGSFTRSRLEHLADEFDACLGAVAGLYWVAHNPYAWVAGDPVKASAL